MSTKKKTEEASSKQITEAVNELFGKDEQNEQVVENVENIVETVEENADESKDEMVEGKASVEKPKKSFEQVLAERKGMVKTTGANIRYEMELAKRRHNGGSVLEERRMNALKKGTSNKEFFDYIVRQRRGGKY